jgi:hypothetical protein
MIRRQAKQFGPNIGQIAIGAFWSGQFPDQVSVIPVCGTITFTFRDALIAWKDTPLVNVDAPDAGLR